MSLKCWTAPGKVFETREALHEHYKTEWHKYNLKRKVANLAPIPEAMFEKLQQIQSEREQAKNSVVKGKSHIKKTKRVDDNSMAAPTEAPLPPDETSTSFNNGTADTLMEADQEQLEDDAEEYQVDEEEMKKEVDYRVCFLDDHVSETFEDNLLYMKKYFGFIIPDLEYCTDVQGVFRYCNKKVLAGKICLLCDRAFKNSKATIQHMVDKSHCKVSLENDEDAEEFEEFYDYSELDAMFDDSDEELSQDDQATGEEGAVKKTAVRKRDKLNVEMLDTGELYVRNETTGESRLIGHRDFRVSYQQKVRVEEKSPAVLANSKERLMLMYKKAGVDTSASSTALARTMYNGGRPAWMDKKLAKQQSTTLHFRKKQDLRDGVQVNRLTKNMQRRAKNVGEGYGVHG